MPDIPTLFSLAGRVAFITGSNRGIGLAIAQGYGASGASVVLNGRDADRTAEAVGSLTAQGIKAHASVLDVTDRDAIAGELARIEELAGPIDILVNNAGMQHRAPVTEFPAGMFEKLMETNLHSAFYMAQAAARLMIPRRSGAIINMCSVQSELGRATIVPYTASKGALKMLTRGLATELGVHGIRVNGLAPGYFRTELNQALVDNPEFSRWLVARTPLGRWGDVGELVGAAIFLASDAASFMTGQLMHIDGGITASI